MSKLHTEATFEEAITLSLCEQGGYKQGNPTDYDTESGLFRNEVLAFIQQTQPKDYNRLAETHGADADSRIIQRLCKELELRGSLDVLRNGFTDYGVKLKMAYFKPESLLNPDTLALYDHNRLKVYRQVYYSAKNKNSVDMVLSLNGIPVATLELKNHFTGQTASNAKQQYSTTRDNRELLFAFKKRALVHFAVDPDEVYMTTRIDGASTYWLPFNKGYDKGKGNPPAEGYRTAYLWENILSKDSLMEIIGRFIHLQVEEKRFEDQIIKKETMIFPRYHQLDAVRKFTCLAREQGAGHNYLIQHSAGSGKSNTIAWLSYRLSALHNEDDQRVFDSVIVVTDRRVLDQQLQNTIYQFEHKTGVVQKIDENSEQLANAITNSTNIIITTLQKFPFILEKVGSLEGRKFAVIIDEAHSSQGGEASKKMKAVLGLTEDEETDNEDIINFNIEQSAAARGKQTNISFFAFTATPKYKTLSVFGRKSPEGKPEPHHLYSMRQAIEEGFILDVLQNYTTYELYFKLTKAIAEDPELNTKKAAQAIGRFVSLHPHNLAQKTEVIIEHFRQIVSKKIGGRAKAMLICGSRLHAKRYFDEFNKYIKLKGYQKEIKVLVAFSGKVTDTDYPKGVSEPQLTGFGEKELPEKFAKDEYKILIVADKYQTGFDQPLLHTMYVDKHLSGVKAVQTLSRLNRTTKGKEDTFVLDFVNEREEIQAAFQEYYEKTTVTAEPDPNHLYDLKARLDQFQVCWQSEIDDFASVYFRSSCQFSVKQQAELYSLVDPAVERFKKLEEDQKEEFKKGIRTWSNLYSFLSQIMPFRDAEFEKYFVYTKYLQTKLPKRNLSEALHLDDEIAMEYYRLQKIKDGSIDLISNKDGELDGLMEAGMKRGKEEKAALSEIIHVLNERFGTEFEDADKLFFDQIESELMADETLQLQAKVNKIDTFKYAFEELFLMKLIERMDQNQDIFDKILEDKAFGGLVKEWMMKKVFMRLNDVK